MRIFISTIYVILFFGYAALVNYGVIRFDWNFTNWLQLGDLGLPKLMLSIEPIVTGIFISVSVSVCVAYQCSKLCTWLAKNFDCLR